MSNLAHKENYKEEILNGEIVLMSPSPSINHNTIIHNIYRIFYDYLRDNPCKVYPDGVDVYLTPKDTVIPDLTIVCDKNKVKNNGIHGVPDLIVEVLSPGTQKNDKGYKKELYERVGVKEYWIVSQTELSIEVYVLKEGKYVLDKVINKIDKEGRKWTDLGFKSSLFENLVIPVDRVFDDMIEV